MAKYTIKSGSHTRWEGDKKSGSRVRYAAGDTIELTPKQAREMGNRIEASTAQPGQYSPSVATATTDATGAATVDSEQSSGAPSKGSDEGGENASDWGTIVKGNTAEGLVELVDELETAGEVEALLAAEQNQAKPRKSVVEAAQGRLKQLS